MLDNAARSDLAAALDALCKGDPDPWNALAPLSRISATGTDVTIDLTTEATLGTPVVIARPRPAPFPHLTPRQAEVCAALVGGASNKAIAAQLGISLATVKDHVHAILDRLGAKSRAEVIALFHGRQISKRT